MEKFKACEKEMKTKAFSKEGLIQASKLDPKAQEKLETTQWLQSKVEELQIQVEQAEAEIESLQGGAKKKNKSGANGRLEELEHLNERRKWHISRLELVLRLLDNGSLSVDKVNELKEDVQYFVDTNTVCFYETLLCPAMLTHGREGRMKALRKTKASMTNLILTRKKRSSAWPRTMTIVTHRQTMKVKVGVCS